MSANYDGQTFDTPLLAHWAAFFDLAGWKWSTGIASVGNWKPDFRATFKCNHSECRGSHTILISVLPVDDLKSLRGHPALRHCYSVDSSTGVRLADAGAVFGSAPEISEWEMSHGAGGGIENVNSWVDNAANLWRKAAQNIAPYSVKA